jgi:hypothetical protein
VRRCGRRGVADGLGVARPTGTPQGSGDNCAGHGGGGGVLIGDGRQWWGEENGPARWHSKAAAELRWLGRASTSPATGRGDEGGEAWSKRGGRWGHNSAHRGGETMT